MNPSFPVLSRRACTLLFAASLAGWGCSRGGGGRCGHCGMKLDMTSAWRSEIALGDKTIVYDSPRCALAAWTKTHDPGASLRVQEFYSRAWKDARDLRFALGSDAQGPMGPDLVPVDPAHIHKFIRDHSAERALSFAEITPSVLDGLK